MPSRKFYSTGPEQSRDATSRVDRILSKLPASMQKYTARLKNAPVSHVAAFLILHELTAVIPLLGLFGVFHYTNFVPIDYMLSNYGRYVSEGVRRFEKYFTRKGYFGFGGDKGVEDEPLAPAGPEDDAGEAVIQRWTSGDSKYRVVVEVALAYTITKILLPVRILGSLWATPWFAGILVRTRGRLGNRR